MVLVFYLLCWLLITTAKEKTLFADYFYLFLKFSTSDNTILASWLVRWISVTSHYNPSNIFARTQLVQTRHVGEYFPTKIGEYPRIFPNFQNCALCENDLKDNKHKSLHLGRKYARIFVLGHYLFLVRLTIFLELRSRKTVRYSEQIMSADKYPSIFSRQMEAIVYLYLLLTLYGHECHKCRSA